MSHFAFVESNTTGTGALAIERALASGHSVTFLTRAAGRYGFLDHPGLRIELTDTNDVALLTNAIDARPSNERVDAVVTSSDFYVSIVAETAQRLGLRALDPRAAARCRHKLRTREGLRDAGLLTPDFFLVSSEIEARAIAESIAYPCVVKPPSDSSSRGVRLVADANELLAQYRVLSGWKENIRGQSLSGDVLVESLLDGPEFSVETLTIAPTDTRVIGITAKHLSAPPHFVETGHDFPADIPHAIASELAAVAIAGLDAMGFDFGPAHTEIRYTPLGPAIVEVNPRLAGGMIPELVAQATGIDLLMCWLDQAIGKPIDLTPRRHDVASIRFVTAAAAGTLTSIDGVFEARGLSTIREVAITASIGNPVKPAEDAYDRLGYVIGSGPLRSQVAREVEQALGLLGINIDAPQHATV